MKAFGKILGLCLLGLLLIIVALGFALTHLFDPNDYKDEIRQLARDKAHLELTLDGDIGWSLFPWLGLELHDARIASLAQPDQPIADLRLLGLSVRVLPLLRKEIEMSDVRLDGLKLNLVRDKQGHGNWQDLGKAPPSSEPAPAETRAPATDAEPAAEPAERQKLRLDIDSLNIRDARIDYQDQQQGQQYSIESLELTTGAIREDQDIALQLSGFFGSNQPLLRASSNLKGTLRFNQALKRYQLENLQLSGEVSGDPLQGKTLSYSAQGQLLVDQVAQIAEWNNLKLSANQLRALGELKVRNLDNAPKLEGALSIAPFNLREFLEGIGQPLPAMADAKALSQVELVSRLSGSQTSLALDELKLNLDGSQFTGTLAVADFARQALRVQLKGDRLDLDRYLAPKTPAAPAAARQAEVKQTVAGAAQGNSSLPSSPTQQAWSEDKILPLERLRSLDLQLALNLGKLTSDQLLLENVDLKATGKGGLLSLQHLRSELQGGSLEANGSLDARTDIPQLRLDSRLKRIPVELFIKSEGQKPPVKGRLDLNASLASSGNSQKAWIDALNGDASFSLKDGVLVEANLEQQLCRAIATLNRKILNSEPRGKDTPFEELKGSLKIRNGVATNPDLKARIPGLTVNGNGDLDLRVLGMDYRVGIILEGDQRQMPDPACQVNQRYVGLEWPLRCRGPLELGAKACRIDQDGLGKVAGKLAGEKLNEKLEEKLGDKLSPELKDALKGLFKR
jgi:AsmA protein